MKVLFLNPPFGYQRPEGLDAPLGIMVLSAVLKQAGHTCALVDHAWTPPGDWSGWEAALDASPDLVLINTQIRFTGETGEALQRVHARQADIPVIAFGPQASTEPARLLALGCIACVVGEPETVIPRLLAHWDSDGSGAQRLPQWPGLATVADPDPDPAPRVDVEELPAPDWELADYRRYIDTTHNAVVMAARGSNRGDAFNQPPLIHATQPTRRCSVPRVLRELSAMRRRFPGAYMVLFHDEVFTEDRAWTVQLCAALREARLGVPFWCFARPDQLDPELARILRRSGFAGVSMGMESGSDRILSLLERGLTAARIEAGFRAAQAAGLLTVGSVMLGTPGTGPGEPDETPEEIEATVRMAQRLHPDVLTITLTTPLPGTALYARVRQRLLLKTPEEFNYYHVWPGKYPVQLLSLSAAQLDRAAAAIRRNWRRGLWKTALRTAALAAGNAAFRRTLRAQVLKVMRRKLH